jgi:hypothetical protein
MAANTLASWVGASMNIADGVDANSIGQFGFVMLSGPMDRHDFVASAFCYLID